MDYSKLRGKIKEVFGTQEAFAMALGKSNQVVTRRLHQYVELSTRDIMEWAEVLGISPDEINVYFFTREVRKSEPKKVTP